MQKEQVDDLESKLGAWYMQFNTAHQYDQVLELGIVTAMGDVADMKGGIYVPENEAEGART